jgi:hypothetical protein
MEMTERMMKKRLRARKERRTKAKEKVPVHEPLRQDHRVLKIRCAERGARADRALAGRPV